MLRMPHRATLPHPIAVLAAFVAAVVIGAGCGSDPAGGRATEAATRTDELQVVTTVAPITSIVAKIGGDRVAVTGLVPEGTNSHTFEPVPSDAKVLAEADVIFINGLKLEEPTRELAEANKKDATPIVELGPMTIPESDYIYDFSFPEEEGKPNPHLWTNPPMARRYAEVAAGELAKADPANAGYYQGNYERFAAEIDELDHAMRTSFDTIPREDRKLLTYHDAYAYFGQEYGWDIIGAIQVSDFEDPTAREVARLIDQVKAEDVPAIFGSEVFPSPVLEQIGREAGVEYVNVLRDDDLPGEPGEPDHSWLGLMRFDFITMTEAMGGDARALAAVRVASVAPDEASYPQ
jgi:ABC-type Zn uptake system ZnuABC Zn-binding protein ZnuA